MQRGEYEQVRDIGDGGWVWMVRRRRSDPPIYLSAAGIIGEFFLQYIKKKKVPMQGSLVAGVASAGLHWGFSICGGGNGRQPNIIDAVMNTADNSLAQGAEVMGWLINLTLAFQRRSTELSSF